MTVPALNKGRPLLLDLDLILSLWPKVEKHYFEVERVREDALQGQEITKGLPAKSSAREAKTI